MNAKILKKVLKYIKRSLPLLFLSIVMSFFVVAFSLAVPLLSGDAIDALIGPGDVDFQRLYNAIKFIAIILLLNALLQWVVARINNRITYKVTKQLREDVMNKISRLSVAYLDSKPTGELLSRMTSDVDQFADGLLVGFTQFFTGVITILGTLFFMFRENVLMALIVVVVTPLSLFVSGFIAKNVFSLVGEQAKIRGEQTAYMDEMVSAHKLIRSSGREKSVIDGFEEINDRYTKLASKAVFFSSLTNPSTRFVNNIVYALVAGFGAFNVIGSLMSVGQLSIFLNYAGQYTKPFNEISTVMAELQAALACAGRVFDFLEETEFKETAKDGFVCERGEVRLDKVCFSYDKSKKLIENLNIEAKPGEKIAIVGPTGCGKTTIINLLMRFYDTDSGRVLVDGVNVKDITKRDLRRSYGMVLQDTWIKAGTIRENISFSRPDASLEEVIEAAKLAHCHGFINRMPNGYDTVLAEDGNGLSQGQKQLICIARVMLNLPKMLILDEATSSIDTRTEQRIQNAFKSMMEGRTSFVVAHRLSTIKNSDKILVMNDGRIIEQGNHEELMKLGGFYANLFLSGMPS